MVAGEATLEEDVLGDRDALVDGEPVGDEQHEVLKDILEVAVARDGDGAVDDGADEGPDEAGHPLGGAREHLQREGHRVDVRAVVGDDGEREDDQAELTESAERWDEHSCEEATDAGGVVAIHVGVVAAVGSHGGADSSTEHLCEDERERQTSEGPEEDRHARTVDGLVDSVVCGVGGPPSAESKDGRSEGENSTSFGLSSAHWEIFELARARKLTQDDQEDDETWDP